MITGMHAIMFSPGAAKVSDRGGGLLAAIRLPDGPEFSICEPRHPGAHPALTGAFVAGGCRVLARVRG